MSRFKEMPMPPSQMLMFPQSVEESIPLDSDVRALSEVMDSLDWSMMMGSYSQTGCPPYPPKVLAKILAYAYSKGIRSSRKIEELVDNDKRYMWLAGGLKPDHNTIARFRKEKWSELTALFEDSVRVCAAAGLVFLNAVSNDGSKVLARASKRSIYDQSRLKREMDAAEKVLQEADEVDRAEDQLYGSGNGRQLPDELKDAAVRKAKIEQSAKRLKESKRNSVVASEPDSRVMKTTSGKRPAYNLQAAVDSHSQVIVGMKLTQSESDHGLLPEMVRQVETNTGLSPDVVLGDCGFSDEATLKWLDERKQEALIACKEHPGESKRNDLFCSKCFLGDEHRDVLICPAGRRLGFQGEYKTGSGMYRQYAATGCRSCSFHKECVGNRRGSRRVMISAISHLRRRMIEKLASPDGKKTFALRKQTVEPVFGQIKRNMRFDRFLLSGLEGASAEVALICMVHNLRKCGRKARATATLALRGAKNAFVFLAGDLIARSSCHTRKPAQILASF